MRKLAGFDVSPGEDSDFVLRLEDEGGTTLEVAATADQLDTIVDAIDDLLSEHEESAFGVEGETYQKPLG
jgi:hypothetical protein